MRTKLDVYGYYRLPRSLRFEFDDWAKSEGIDLGDLYACSVELGEGFVWVECIDREAFRAGREETFKRQFPVKTLPPRAAFEEDA